MLRGLVLSIMSCSVLVSGAARAQAPGAPLQLLHPSEASPKVPGATHAAVPNNWKIVNNGRDPLTERTSRVAITLPKPNSTQKGKSGATGLALVCLSSDANGPTDPAVALIFTSLAGVGHYKRFPINYRFDEGSVTSSVATADIGKGGARRILLPTVDMSPVAAIRAAQRLRVEVDLRTAGIVFLDFNVAGASAAIEAIACQ